MPTTSGRSVTALLFVAMLFVMVLHVVNAASVDVDSLIAAHASEYAYDTTDKINEKFRVRDAHSRVLGTLELIQTIKSPAGAWCKTYRVADSDTIVVSYRGSKTTTDWVNNLNIDTETAVLGPSSSKAGNVHEGFWDSYKSTKSYLLQYISKLLTKNTKVIFTGHSQGGSVAMIGALDLAYHYPQMKSNIKLITFGQPRTVKSDFMKLFNNNISHYTRYVIMVVDKIKDFTGKVIYSDVKDDVVSTVPPKILGFQHTGNRVDLWCPLNGFVKCHDMTVYLGALKTKMDGSSASPQ